MRVLFLVILFSLVGAQKFMYENVFFHKIGEFSMSRSKWLLSFIIDLGVYENFILKLSRDIDQAHLLAITIADRFGKTTKNTDYDSIFNGFKNEILVIQQIHDDIKLSFGEYSLLRNSQDRRKRRILGFVGDLMSSLFGVLTEADVSSIQRNVRKLAQNQLDISHVVQEYISVLNSSKIEIRENRQKINDVISTIESVEREILNATNSLGTQIRNTENFVVLASKLDLVIEEIKNALSRSMYFYLHFQIQMQAITMQKLSPSTISANDLRDVLLSVQGHLPKTLGLPYDPHKHLIEYFKFLECVTMFDGTHIIVTTYVPLMEQTQIFDIYRAYSLPVPIIGERASGKKELIAYYKLESPYLAINSDRSKYIMLQETHVAQCNNPISRICNFQEPVRNVNVLKHCLMANFNRDKKLVRRYCDVWLQNARLPNAIYLSNDVYLVVTKSTLKFYMSCKDGKPSRKRLFIHEPYGFLSLHKNCQAVTDEFTLVGYYENKSTKLVNDTATPILRAYNFTDLNAWDDIHKFKQVTNNSLNIPDKLADTSEFSLKSLMTELENMRPMEEMKTNHFPAWGYMVILLGFIILASIFIKCFPKLKKLKLCSANETRENKMLQTVTYRCASVEPEPDTADETRDNHEKSLCPETSTSRTQDSMTKFPALDSGVLFKTANP